MLVYVMWDDNRGWTFSGGSINTDILARSEGLKLRYLNDGFVSYKHSFLLHIKWIDGLESCQYLDCCDICIYSSDHSGGTHSLQRIYWAVGRISSLIQWGGWLLEVLIFLGTIILNSANNNLLFLLNAKEI